MFFKKHKFSEIGYDFVLKGETAGEASIYLGPMKIATLIYCGNESDYFP
jgi:hypothetical protein